MTLQIIWYVETTEKATLYTASLLRRREDSHWTMLNMTYFTTIKTTSFTPPSVIKLHLYVCIRLNMFRFLANHLQKAHQHFKGNHHYMTDQKWIKWHISTSCIHSATVFGFYTYCYPFQNLMTRFFIHVVRKEYNTCISMYLPWSHDKKWGRLNYAMECVVCCIFLSIICIVLFI
jgi:hypothetical protein